MSKFFVRGKETSGPDDWRTVVGNSKWSTGYSAKALAYCWEEASGIPPDVKRLFSESPSPRLRRPDMLVAFPEYKVSIPGRGGASQNDIFAVVKSEGELISLMVEGKVSEPFDLPVADWLGVVTSPSGRSDKPRRLKCLLNKLEIIDKDVRRIGYQLFHRTTSALIEAERFGATTAVMLVHSFSQQDEHIDDYKDFVALFGATGDVNTVSYAGSKNGIDLYLAWVRGEERFLHR